MSRELVEGLSWVAPELHPAEKVEVVRAQLTDNRGENLLKWAQKKALDTIDAAQVEAEEIRRSAQEIGYTEGRQQAEADILAEQTAQRQAMEAEIRQLRESVQSQLQDSLCALRREHLETSEQLQTQFRDALLDLALEIGTKLSLRSLQEYGVPLDSLIGESMKVLGDPPKVKVRIGDRNQLDPLRQESGSRYDVVHDDTLEDWDVIVESVGGEARILYQDRILELREILLTRLS